MQAQDRATLARFAESEDIKSLRDEIGLARMMVERHWNMIKTENDYISRAPSINTLLLTIERLIKSSHAIEQSLESLLSRTSVIAFAQLLVQIVMDELEVIPNHEPVADRILKRVMATLTPGAAKSTSFPQLASRRHCHFRRLAFVAAGRRRVLKHPRSPGSYLHELSSLVCLRKTCDVLERDPLRGLLGRRSGKVSCRQPEVPERQYNRGRPER